MKENVSLKSKVKEFLILITTLFYIPIPKKNRKILSREKVISKVIKICIHEWGGYTPRRLKRIKNSDEFYCGLTGIYKILENYEGTNILNLSTTVSDWEKYKGRLINPINLNENKGFDLGGYSTFINRELLRSENNYVILCNSSINEVSDQIIDSYIHYMDNNLDVGMIGSSIGIKRRLSSPFIEAHIQTFFIITTSEILFQIIDRNHGLFPGESYNNKRLIIRLGEIKLSRLISDIGYMLAFVDQDGFVHKFNYYTISDQLKSLFSNKNTHDYRFIINNPNKLHKIKAV